MKIIYLGAGGFWTTEAVFQKVKGVTEVIPGYMGGTVPYPTHEAVSTGATGHAEVVQVAYDESVIEEEALLKIFFAMHDASAPNHTGNTVGSQYRSVIFYTEDNDGEATNPENGHDIGAVQRAIEALKATLPEEIQVATQAMTATEFYPADESHYNFYTENPEATYATTVIEPKLKQVQSRFPEYF